jgi:hypothetical protein
LAAVGQEPQHAPASLPIPMAPELAGEAKQFFVAARGACEAASKSMAKIEQGVYLTGLQHGAAGGTLIVGALWALAASNRSKS